MVIWDVGSFDGAAPTDSSRFTLVELFEDGEDGVTAATSVTTDSIYARNVHPMNSLTESSLSQVGLYLAYAEGDDYNEWIRELSEQQTSNPDQLLPEDDINQNGRSNFEEYTLGQMPRIARESGQNAANGADVTLELRVRGNADGLTYQLHTSSNLVYWEQHGLIYSGKHWASSSTNVRIIEQNYAGRGEWDLRIDCTDESSEQMFVRVQVD